MSDVFTNWYVHRVDVRSLTSVADDGAQTFETHLQVPCWKEDTLTRTKDEFGVDAVSSAKLHLALQYKDWFTPGSEVTTSDGESTRVLQRLVADSVGQVTELDGVTAVLA